MSINTWSIGDFFIGDSSDLMDNEKVIQQFGDVIVYFWKNRVKELFPKKEIIGDFMNYNSLVFRKDMTGVDEYVKWSGITADLMRAYLYSQRSIINGVSLWISSLLRMALMRFLMRQKICNFSCIFERDML